MKNYLCRFTYKDGNGYALVAAERISALLGILVNQGTWEGIHLVDAKEVDATICSDSPLIITSGCITTLQCISGASAYDIAVLKGFSGTIEEWLESMSTLDDEVYNGFTYIDTTLGMPVFAKVYKNNGTNTLEWLDNTIIKSGSSLPESGVTGQMFFYEPTGGLSIPVWWSGETWVKADGSPVLTELTNDETV